MTNLIKEMTNLIEKKETKIEMLSDRMEKRKETRITITEQMWEFKYKLHEELKVEETAFFP